MKMYRFQLYNSIKTKYLLFYRPHFTIKLRTRKENKSDHEKQIEILENWRKNLLEQIHEKEKKISCLDYLIYKLQKG